MSALARDRGLRLLRLRLTAWYVGTFLVILLLLGVGLFQVIARQLSDHLDRSLRVAIQEVLREARVRQSEGREARGSLVEAVGELQDDERPLYLLDGRGRLLVPEAAHPRVVQAGTRALRGTPVDLEFSTDTGQRWRLRAVGFREGGAPYALVAVADLEGVEGQTLRVLEAFEGAAALALVLVGIGGYRLAGISTRPVERSMERMRRFIADAAHELRTPVAVLRGRSEVALERERAPEEYVSALRGVAREAERMGAIVDDLLTLARADAGEQPVRREPCYLDDLAGDAVSTLQVLADSRGVRLEVGRYEEAPTVGDPVLLGQLFRIVLDNAVKYTPPGGSVRLDVFAEDDAARVVVEDTGVGIPPDALPHVFERFYRADPARAPAMGTGLGLSIARWIADAHGARIDLESEPGRGTRVLLRFPRSL
ncbi:MAG: HAMP domain-containing histidine kinase [Gemmatimonadetes bacterium]|nr:HAMP domain-containing histidine kinase [Gemmatimonadota bacterium]